MANYTVHAFWDAEAGVWVATSDDVPGLITEASDVPRLVAKLQVLIPELLEANRVLPYGPRDIPVCLLYDHRQQELSVHYC